MTIVSSLFRPIALFFINVRQSILRFVSISPRCCTQDESRQSLCGSLCRTNFLLVSKIEFALSSISHCDFDRLPYYSLARRYCHFATVLPIGTTEVSQRRHPNILFGTGNLSITRYQNSKVLYQFIQHTQNCTQIFNVCL